MIRGNDNCLINFLFRQKIVLKQFNKNFQTKAEK